LVLRRANNTKAAPNNVNSGNLVGGISFYGYTSGGWAASQSAEIDVFATEAYNTGTAGKGGAQIVFGTRANGAASLTGRMTIDQDGSVVIPYIWATAVNGTAVQINSNGILTKATSSLRYKTNVRELPQAFGPEFVMGLRPIVYNNKFGDDHNDYVGFVAEEVFDGGGGPFISFNDDGLVESLHYDKLTVPLVAMAQAQQRRIERLEARVMELERKMAA